VLIVGIDCGLRGAIAAVDSAAKKGSAQVWLMPVRQVGDERARVDEDRLFEILRPLSGAASAVVYENLHAMPLRFKRKPKTEGEEPREESGGVLVNHARGRAMGLIQMALVALQIPRNRRIAVVPQAWQKALLFNIPCGGDTKAQAIWLALRLFPDVSLFASARSRGYHDGIADALCLAEYGRCVLAGGKGRQLGLLPAEVA
jgi:crossover junction endodeoxyribonuclease RuvC